MYYITDREGNKYAEYPFGVDQKTYFDNLVLLQVKSTEHRAKEKYRFFGGSF